MLLLIYKNPFEKYNCQIIVISTVYIYIISLTVDILQYKHIKVKEFFQKETKYVVINKKAGKSACSIEINYQLILFCI